MTTPQGGFNPTWQRHVAAYALCAPLLSPGKVLDLGCGVGHSYELLNPRQTVGVDLDADALAGQAREAVVADMRALPFADDSFGSVLAVQSIEHVPDAQRAVREAARVLNPTGLAVLVTPNRLTFARPDEIIDPYHYVEYDPDQLRRLSASGFETIELRGIFGSARYLELVTEERARLDALLRKDPLRARRLIPRRMRQRLYDLMLTRARRQEDARAAAIVVEDFDLREEGLESALDLVAVCRTPIP